jgi:hypothetical protein
LWLLEVVVAVQPLEKLVAVVVVLAVIKQAQHL